MSKVVIDLVGDPMLDMWYNPTEWYATPGGAFNVYENIRSLIKDKENILLKSLFYPLELRSMPPLEEAKVCGYPVKLYNCNKDWSIKEQKDSLIHSSNSETCICKTLFPTLGYPILVVSDYKKGFVTKHLANHLLDKHYHVCIVDSRYANTKFSLLREHCDVLIYRKTNKVDEECDFDWDFKIQSSGEDSTILFDRYGAEKEIPIIDKKESVCSIGCGDTFTATIAASIACLAERKETKYGWVPFKRTTNYLPTFNELIGVINDAHNACQEVVAKPRTAIVEKFKIK